MAKGNKSSSTIRRKTQKLPTGILNSSLKNKPINDPSEKHFNFRRWAFQSDDEPEIEKKNVFGPKSISQIMMAEKTIFLGLVVLRIVNVFMIQTSFVPDEYWQSLEVAHKTAFGYGYLTWEWREGLRGYTYPLIFSILYKLLEILHLDYRILVIKLPKILHALLASVGDLYLYKFSRRVADQTSAQWSLFCQITSWFTFYCCTRTLTNSIEASFTPIILYYFPWPNKTRKSQWKFVLLVAVNFILRPTSAILWLPMCLWHLWLHTPFLILILKIYIYTGIFVLAISSFIDKHFYGDWVIVHWNFLKFNFISDLGTFYGSHPWHWYLTQGFSIIMFTHMLPFMLAVRQISDKNIKLLQLIIWTICVYSILGHKEFRFIYPILPIAMHLTGEYLASLNEEIDEKTSARNQWFISKARILFKTLVTKKTAALFLLLTNIPVMLYTGLIHQRGTLDVMKFLSTAASNMPGYKKMDVLFLMPCHSTPYYSYLHTNVSMRFLTCEPDLTGNFSYKDEADIFYESPLRWLKEQFPANNANITLPTHLVYFNVLFDKINQFLLDNGYRECGQIFHTHFSEGRIGSHILVSCR